MSHTDASVLLKEKGTQIASTLKEEEASYKENQDKNGCLTDEAFVSETGSIEWQKVLDEALWQQLKEAGKEKTVADMAFATFLSGALFLPKALESAFKEAQRLTKEQHEKLQAAKNKFIEDALKAKGMTKTGLVTQLALRAQEWLFSPKNVILDEKGYVQTRGLTHLQRAHTKKYLFAHTLPVNKDGTLAFNRFSRYQAVRFTKYLLIYAQYDSDFNRYIRSVAETVLSKEELIKLGRFAASMSLKGDTTRHLALGYLVTQHKNRFYSSVTANKVKEYVA